MIRAILNKKNIFLNKFIKNFFCNRYIVFAFCLIFMLSSCYLDFYLPLKKFIMIATINLPYLIFAIYFLNFKFSKFTLALCLYSFFGIISCIFGEYTYIQSFTDTYFPIFGLTLYLEMALRTNCQDTIKSFSMVMFLLVFINFLTILIWPNGMYFNGMYYTNWFFTYDNGHIFLFLPTIVLVYISLFYNSNFFKIICGLSVFMITYCVYYCFSVNTVMAYTPLLIYRIFEKKLSNLKILNVYTYFIIYILIFIFIVGFRMQYLFSWLLVDILHKGLTLNSRTQIWNMVIEKIKKAPILGYGLENGKVFSENFGVVNYTHAHNTILDVLYKGGLTLLLCFFFIINLTLKKLKENKHLISKFISFVIFSMFLMMNFEARQEKIGLYIVLVIGYNIDCIVHSISHSNIEVNNN